MAEIRKYHITVTAKTLFIPEQSDEAAERYVFSYTITISNTGQIAAQLISRHWQIIDATRQQAIHIARPNHASIAFDQYGPHIE